MQCLRRSFDPRNDFGIAAAPGMVDGAPAIPIPRLQLPGQTARNSQQHLDSG